MARQILQQCVDCGAWCLETTCPACGGKAQASAPLKWSPEDHRANVRRQLNEVESPEWPQTIPTLPSLEEMRTGSQEQEEE
jgi:rRNA maturation protein Nop10